MLRFKLFPFINSVNSPVSQILHNSRIFQVSIWNKHKSIFCNPVTDYADSPADTGTDVQMYSVQMYSVTVHLATTYTHVLWHWPITDHHNISQSPVRILSIVPVWSLIAACCQSSSAPQSELCKNRRRITDEANVGEVICQCTSGWVLASQMKMGVWQKLESMVEQFIRLIMEVPVSTPKIALHAETGLLSLIHRVWVENLNLVLAIRKYQKWRSIRNWIK